MDRTVTPLLWCVSSCSSRSTTPLPQALSLHCLSWSKRTQAQEWLGSVDLPACRSADGCPRPSPSTGSGQASTVGPGRCFLGGSSVYGLARASTPSASSRPALAQDERWAVRERHLDLRPHHPFVLSQWRASQGSDPKLAATDRIEPADSPPRRATTVEGR